MVPPNYDRVGLLRCVGFSGSVFSEAVTALPVQTLEMPKMCENEFHGLQQSCELESQAASGYARLEIHASFLVHKTVNYP